MHFCRLLRRVLPTDDTDPAGADYAGNLCRFTGGRIPWLQVWTDEYCYLPSSRRGGSPRFSMMRSGVSVIAGPAGGFIIGFAVMAFVTGLISEKYGYSFKTMLIASVCGTLGCYILGIAWFIFLTGTGVWSAFLLCMFPFLPGDLAKILLASFLVSKYRGRLIQG